MTNNATCHGDVTLFSAAVVACNGRHLFNASWLVEITGSLQLTSLPADINITSMVLPNLVAIGQDLYVAEVGGYYGGDIVTFSFPSLINVSGSITFSFLYTETVELPSLRHVGGSVSFDHLHSETVELPSLRAVGGSVSLWSLTANTTVNLAALAIVGGDLQVGSVSLATDLRLPSLYSVGGDVSQYRTAPVGLTSLTHIEGDFYITTRYYYPSVEAGDLGPPSLRYVGGSVTIEDERYFFSTLSFPALRTIGDALSVVQGRATGLDLGKLESVGSNFYLTNYYDLSSLNASALHSVGGDFLLERDDSLTEVSFGSLAFVRGYLKITGCDALVVAYFNSLASVGIPRSASTPTPAYSYSYSGSSYDESQATYCSVSGDYENLCIEDNTALESIAFPSLDYDSSDIAVASGPWLSIQPIQPVSLEMPNSDHASSQVCALFSTELSIVTAYQPRVSRQHLVSRRRLASRQQRRHGRQQHQPLAVSASMPNALIVIGPVAHCSSGTSTAADNIQRPQAWSNRWCASRTSRLRVVLS